MRFAMPALALATVACRGHEHPWDTSGAHMSDYFPFDGTRTWELVSTDVDVGYRYVAEMRSSEPEVVDGLNVYTVDYRRDCVDEGSGCVDEVARTIEWVNDRVEGVFLYGWTEGAWMTRFDPPLRISDTYMRVGDALETTTAGADWIVTLEAFEVCPVRMNVDWRDCARFRIDDGDADDATGAGLVGTYWAGPFNNVVAVQLAGEQGTWELAAVDCQPEEDCRGEW